jgi:putative tricarboxylic transport membrane protein
MLLEGFNLGEILTLTNILFIVLGLVWGAICGALPGLSVTVAMVTILPFAITLPPIAAMCILGGAIGGGFFAGSVPAILVNVPGTAANLATLFDGHPMALKGQAGRALGISATASGLSAMVGLIIGFVVLAYLRKVIFAFSHPEIFLLVLLGLSAIAVITRGSTIKGLAAAGFGILIGLIGFHGATGAVRFTFGLDLLWDRLSLLPVFLGVFAIGQMITLALEGRQAIATQQFYPKMSDTLQGIRDVFTHRVCFLRSSILGWIVGIIPGIGATTANILSYGVAVQTSSHPETFGEGEVEGVIAAEAANNGTQGGSLLPTVAFGVPGSLDGAVIIAILFLVGIQPGPLMVMQNFNIIAALFVSVLLANIAISTMGLFLAVKLAWLTKVNTNLIIPLVMCLSLVGAYVAHMDTMDMVVAIVFAFFGAGMTRYGFSRAAFIIAFILGRIAESTFHGAWAMGYGSPVLFFTRPIALTVLVLIVALYLNDPIRRLIRRRSE